MVAVTMAVAGTFSRAESLILGELVLEVVGFQALEGGEENTVVCSARSLERTMGCLDRR